MKSSSLSKRKPSYGGPATTGGLLGSSLQGGITGASTLKPRFKMPRASAGNARLNYSANDGMPSFLLDKNQGASYLGGHKNTRETNQFSQEIAPGGIYHPHPHHQATHSMTRGLQPQQSGMDPLNISINGGQSRSKSGGGGVNLKVQKGSYQQSRKYSLSPGKVQTLNSALHHQHHQSINSTVKPDQQLLDRSDLILSGGISMSGVAEQKARADSKQNWRSNYSTQDRTGNYLFNKPKGIDYTSQKAGSRGGLAGRRNSAGQAGVYNTQAPSSVANIEFGIRRDSGVGAASGQHALPLSSSPLKQGPGGSSNQAQIRKSRDGMGAAHHPANELIQQLNAHHQKGDKQPRPISANKSGNVGIGSKQLRPKSSKQGYRNPGTSSKNERFHQHTPSQNFNQVYNSRTKQDNSFSSLSRPKPPSGNNLSSYNQQLLQQMTAAGASGQGPVKSGQPAPGYGRRVHSKQSNSATHKRHPTQIASTYNEASYATNPSRERSHLLSATPEPPSTNSDLGPPSFMKKYNNYVLNKLQVDDASATPQKTDGYKIGGHKKSHQHQLQRNKEAQSQQRPQSRGAASRSNPAGGFALPTGGLEGSRPQHPQTEQPRGVSSKRKNDSSTLDSNASRVKSREGTRPRVEDERQEEAKGHDASGNTITSHIDSKAEPLPDPKGPNPKNVVGTLSYWSRVGMVPNNPYKMNQDAYIIVPYFGGESFQHLFSVCDGHGQNGHDVSGLIKQRLPVYLDKELQLQAELLQNPNASQAVKKRIYEEIRGEHDLHQRKSIYNLPIERLCTAFVEAFLQMNFELYHAGFDIRFSGSTCVMVTLFGDRLLCANVGDSRSVLARVYSGSLVAQALNRDHKPDEVDEASRVLSNGGRIESFKDMNREPIGPLRVWLKYDDVPGLAMTRSMGDSVAAKAGVIAEPEIFELQLTSADKFIIIASDGVWEFISNIEAAKVVYPYYEKNAPDQAAEALVKESFKRWKKEEEVIDDITCIIVFLDMSSGSGVNILQGQVTLGLGQH